LFGAVGSIHISHNGLSHKTIRSPIIYFYVDLNLDVRMIKRKVEVRIVFVLPKLFEKAEVLAWKQKHIV
jgi:hypothetical protein